MDITITDRGYLRIGNEADRTTVAAILYKNGYSVSPARKKKDGRSFEYFVEYYVKKQDIEERQ